MSSALFYAACLSPAAAITRRNPAPRPRSGAMTAVPATAAAISGAAVAIAAAGPVGMAAAGMADDETCFTGRLGSRQDRSPGISRLPFFHYHLRLPNCFKAFFAVAKSQPMLRANMRHRPSSLRLSWQLVYVRP